MHLFFPPEHKELADTHSHFYTTNNIEVHYKLCYQNQFLEHARDIFQQSTMRVFVLMHGFGASLYSWQPVNNYQKYLHIFIDHVCAFTTWYCIGI